MRNVLRSVSTTEGSAAPNWALIFRFSKTDLRACRLSAKSLSTLRPCAGGGGGRFRRWGSLVDDEGLVNGHRRAAERRHMNPAKPRRDATTHRGSGERRPFDGGRRSGTVVGEGDGDLAGAGRSIGLLATLRGASCRAEGRERSGSIEVGPRRSGGRLRRRRHITDVC